MAIQVVILAAGQGKRMYSDLPKVLQPLAGKPLLEYVVNTAITISPSQKPFVVYGHQGKLIKNTMNEYEINWVEQKEQLGTGHALQQVLPFMSDEDHALVLYGDVPLISPITLKKLIDSTHTHAIGMLTAELNNPIGYGRIIRNHQHSILQIVEEKEANEEELKIKEINPGIYFIPAKYLKKWLPVLKNKNTQGEYYLTDVVSFAVQENISINTVQPMQTEEIFGVNDKMQLAQLERFYQRQLAEKWMSKGVTIADPNRLDIRGDISIGRDVFIDVNVIMEGSVSIGNQCVIGSNTFLRDVTIANNVEIKSHCVLEGAEIAANCVIGPFARLRPGTILSEEVHVGNFVEIKKSVIDRASKVNHLTYIGDADIGKNVNVGAGTITCNYDGVQKHKTVIADNVLIGSDTLLVAPVSIGEGATIGAGSIVTKDAPPHALTLTHKLEQRADRNWQRPKKDKA